ncbi:MAG: pentapeptide repeat-containing protein [Cyclobacteriaceae bacterium]
MSKLNIPHFPAWKYKHEKGLWRNIQNFIEHPVYVSLSILMLCTFFVTLVSYSEYRDNFNELWIQVVGELHGVVFDVLILGILFGWFDRLRDKRQRIRRYLEELDDTKQWKSQEAGFKTVGNIRRLNGLGVYEFELNEHFISKAKLSGLRLESSYLSKTNLRSTKIINTTLSYCTICDSQAKHLFVQDSKLLELYSANTNYCESRFTNSSLKASYLAFCNFNDSYIIKVDFSGSVLIGCSFVGARLEKVDFRNCIGLSPEMLQKASSLIEVKLDPEIEKEVIRLREETYNKPKPMPQTIELNLVPEE